MKRTGGEGTRAAGLALLEMALGGMLLSVIIGGVFLATAQMARSASSGGTDAQLLKRGRRALAQIRGDLQQSGFFVDEDGALDLAYPHLFEDGEPGEGFEIHAHEPPEPPQWAEGVSREIVFRLPADADGDGTPDLDADFDASWGDEEVSYVLVPAQGGGNRLERRVDGVLQRVVARGVDRVAFDDAVSSGLAVPLHSMRVRIDFAKTDVDGVLHRYSVETVFRLRNGGIVE